VPSLHAPPTLHASDSALAATLVILIVAAVALAAHCVHDAWRARTLVPVFALLGGIVALPIEPFWDVNVQFAFAANSHPIAFTAFGRDIPLYLALIYPAFIGWGSYVGYRLIREGASRRALLRLPVVFFVADAVIEIVGIRAHLWEYYGHQSFTIVGWPIYFGVLNGMIPLLGGALLTVAAPRLRGAERVALAFAVPAVYAGIYAAAGWPMWAALNAHVARSVDWLAGATLIALCVLVARHLATRFGAPPLASSDPVVVPVLQTAR
jgi:hypothetical protein